MEMMQGLSRAESDTLRLEYWRAPDGLYVFGNRKDPRSEMVAWFLEQIAASTLNTVEIHNKLTGKSTFLFPSTIRKIRSGTWTLSSLLIA